jgi:hypothetical protein
VIVPLLAHSLNVAEGRVTVKDAETCEKAVVDKTARSIEMMIAFFMDQNLY